jgi:ankyrin repeat protein
MKHLLLTTIAAGLLVGCGESQQSAPTPEATPVEPVAEVATPEPPTAKAPDISIHNSIHKAAYDGNIEAVKQHLAAGTDVNAKNNDGWTPLHFAGDRGGHRKITEIILKEAKPADRPARWPPLQSAFWKSHNEIIELLISNGADVNAKTNDGGTPLDQVSMFKHPEIADLLRKHGGKTGEELKAEGK